MGSPWVNGNFTFDMSDNLLFEKNENNYIDALGIQQLNTIGNIYFLDIYLSEGNSVEFHYHPNASELTYCICGMVEVAFINPNNNEWETFELKPGDVVSIPQGFWHYAKALTDDTHLLATHDVNNLQTIFGSDLLLHTPKETLADVYCLNEELITEALKPIKDTVIIGPPSDCNRGESEVGGTSEDDCSEDMVQPEKMKDNVYNKQHWNKNEVQQTNNHIYRPMERQKSKEMRNMSNVNPVRYGGEVMQGMNVCEECMRHFEP